MGDLRAVIFDVDGTLVDSERHGHLVAFNRAFEALDLPDRWDEEHYGRLLDIAGGKERLRHHFSGRGVSDDELKDLVGAVHARKNEFFNQLAAEGRIPERPGVSRLLDELESRGVVMALATTGSSEWVEPLVDDLFGLKRFAVVITNREAPIKKPEPDAFEVALEKLELPAEEAVAVEDSAKGVVAAKATSLPCVMVVNDYTKDEDEGGADLVLDSFGEPDAPATVLRNPLSLAFDGVLTAEVLSELHARAPR